MIRGMKHLDVKSVIIGGLLVVILFFGLGATGMKDTWNKKQQWQFAIWKEEQVAKGWRYSLEMNGNLRSQNWSAISKTQQPVPLGWEPIGGSSGYVEIRRRIK